MSFDDLLELCHALGIRPGHERWLDDEWPDREDELRVRVMDKIDKENEK